MSVRPPHPNTAVTQLQAQSSFSLPALLIQCAKVKFVSPHSYSSDGYLRTPSLTHLLTQSVVKCLLLLM